MATFIGRTLAKDFHNLLKNIHSLSGGQARVSDWDDEDLSTFEVEIAPTDGLYKSAKFKFQFELSEDCYQEVTPSIICKTNIYHPNIDTIECTDSTNVCVSLLDEWDTDKNLDDCVQALLFLFYNPNLEDPLCPVISSEMTDDDFEENVKLSLEGGDVDDVWFETNYGYIENGIITEIKTECTETETRDNIETTVEVNSETSEKITIASTEVNSEITDEPNIEPSVKVNVETSEELSIETAEMKIESTEREIVETGVNISSLFADNLKEHKIANENKTGEEFPKDLDDSKVTDKNCGSQRNEKFLTIKSDNRSKFRQFCDKLKNILKFLPNNRIHGSDKKIQVTSNDISDLYVVDNLVPYNKLVSTLCSHFTRTMYKAKL